MGAHVVWLGCQDLMEVFLSRSKVAAA